MLEKALPLVERGLPPEQIPEARPVLCELAGVPTPEILDAVAQSEMPRHRLRTAVQAFDLDEETQAEVQRFAGEMLQAWEREVEAIPHVSLGIGFDGFAFQALALKEGLRHEVDWRAEGRLTPDQVDQLTETLFEVSGGAELGDLKDPLRDAERVMEEQIARILEALPPDPEMRGKVRGLIEEIGRRDIPAIRTVLQAKDTTGLARIQDAQREGVEQGLRPLLSREACSNALSVLFDRGSQPPGPGGIPGPGNGGR